MQVPTLGAWKRLKRIGRHLVGRPRCVQRFPLQPEVQSLTVKVDSDFAGCKETRLSTSCSILLHGKHVLRCSSSTQKIRGFSARWKCASATPRTLGKLSGRTWRRIRRQPKVLPREEAWARYVIFTHHWLLRRVTHRELRFWKVPGSDNEADIDTQLLSGDMLDRILTNLDFAHTIGQDERPLTSQTKNNQSATFTRTTDKRHPR